MKFCAFCGKDVADDIDGDHRCDDDGEVIGSLLDDPCEDSEEEES